MTAGPFSTAPRPFSTVLVANRGEIAVRVLQAAREAGLGSVAVYSDADAGSLHVEVADEAVHISGETLADTYLNSEAIISAALSSGADAVHPGYGFLSERSDFASAVADAGLVWIGPPAEAISTMGDKISARIKMIEQTIWEHWRHVPLEWDILCCSRPVPAVEEKECEQYRSQRCSGLSTRQPRVRPRRPSVTEPSMSKASSLARGTSKSRF